MMKRLIFFIFLFSLASCFNDKKSPGAPLPPPPPETQTPPPSSAGNTFNGGDSSGGAIVEYEPPPPQYATESQLRNTLNLDSRRLTWAFFNQALTHVNFPYRNHVMERLNTIHELLLKRDSFEVKSDHCKNQWGLEVHASIWPDNATKKSICISTGQLAKKNILFSEASAVMGSVVAHEIAHLIDLSTETEAQAIEKYFLMTFVKFKDLSLITGSPHWALVRIREAATQARILPTRTDQRWVQICNALRKYMRETNVIGGTIFTLLEQDYIEALKIKAAYDYMNTCDTAWQGVRDQAYSAQREITTNSFAEILRNLGMSADLNLDVRRRALLPSLPLQDFNDPDFLLKTMQESEQYMNRILFFFSSMSSCKIHPRYGLFSTCNLTEYSYNASFPPEVFVPWNFPED